MFGVRRPDLTEARSIDGVAGKRLRANAAELVARREAEAEAEPGLAQLEVSAANHRHKTNGGHRADDAGCSNRAPCSQLGLEPVVAAKGDQPADEAEQLDDDDRNNGRPQPVP